MSPKTPPVPPHMKTNITVLPTPMLKSLFGHQKTSHISLKGHKCYHTPGFFF
jgi:hypothetical protein